MERHHQHQKFEEKDVENKTSEGSKLVREESGIKQAQASSSSASSSPAHDFSFTISLHNTCSSSATTPDKSKPPLSSSSFALDLSPADDIFFHGHLLPLHLLSHLPVSPRSSTTSMDSFTLPVREYGSTTSSHKSNFTVDDGINKNNSSSNSSQESRRNKSGSRKGGSKSKSFSIFGFTRESKEFQVTEKEEEDDKEKHKRKVRFDMVRIVKKYLRMVQPLVSFRGRKEKIRQSYSYSGNLMSTINKGEVVKGRGGEYSAPASMRTSPTNSGLLLPTPTFPPASDSTMEELQAAIQAAIAHCKNSIAKDDKLKC
ncbi:hypothetical protein QN277_015490 [Acacia crassicarpa]|nr:hypothetical protein QN277_015490 [Acacia crassicarpa]